MQGLGREQTQVWFQMSAENTERLGERSCAYVIPKDGVTVTLEEIVSFLKEKKLAIQKLPERLEIVEEFPMTLSGKVQKYLLREDIAKKLEAEKKE